jgi:hypothetical protein
MMQIQVNKLEIQDIILTIQVSILIIELNKFNIPVSILKTQLNILKSQVNKLKIQDITLKYQVSIVKNQVNKLKIQVSKIIYLAIMCFCFQNMNTVEQLFYKIIFGYCLHLAGGSCQTSHIFSKKMKIKNTIFHKVLYGKLNISWG